MKTPVNLNEFELLASEKLAPEIFDYYAGGANDEITLKENCLAYQKIKLLPRILANVGGSEALLQAGRNLSLNLFGQQLSCPILIAPMGLQGAATPEGEKATAKAAKTAKTIMVLSMMSNYSLEEVSQVTNQPLWFQLYVAQDKKITESLVARAEKSGYEALIVTVDAITLGKRERDIRNEFSLPQNLQASNLLEYGLADIFSGGKDSGIVKHAQKFFKSSLSWQDIEWLKTITDLPIIIKGIMHPEDAALATESGVAGIIVSNHGGRQLDTVPATIEVLPEIAKIVNHKIKLFIDGGIRRGTDVLKALVLGADAVFIGRPILWGLAVDGEKGASKVMEILKQELDIAMALCGYSSILDLKAKGNSILRLQN